MDPESDAAVKPPKRPPLKALIEAVVLAAPEPVTVRQLARILFIEEPQVQLAIDALNSEYDSPEHGIFLRFVRGGYQIATKPAFSEDLRDLLRSIRAPHEPSPALHRPSEIERHATSLPRRLVSFRKLVPRTRVLRSPGRAGYVALYLGEMARHSGLPRWPGG